MPEETLPRPRAQSSQGPAPDDARAARSIERIMSRGDPSCCKSPCVSSCLSGSGSMSQSAGAQRQRARPRNLSFDDSPISFDKCSVGTPMRCTYDSFDSPAHSADTPLRRTTAPQVSESPAHSPRRPRALTAPHVSCRSSSPREPSLRPVAPTPAAAVAEQHVVAVEAHKKQNGELTRRLKAFDRRFTHGLKNAQDAAENRSCVPAASGADAGATAMGRRKLEIFQSNLARAVAEGEAMPTSRRKSRHSEVFCSFAKEEAAAPRTRSHLDGHTLEEVDTKDTDVDLRFRVVDCSSECSSAPASSLAKTCGRWKTASTSVHKQSVTLELTEGPGTVSAVRLTLPGDESNPRRCRVHCSATSAVGPWREGWEFEVRSERCLVFESKHDYSRYAKEYKELLLAHCGSMQAAWNDLLDLNKDGRLTYSDFAMASDRIQLSVGGPPNCWTWTDNVQALFQSLDADNSGYVRLDDLERTGGYNPVATWWRLTIHDNWGSSRDVQLVAPLKLIDTQHESRGSIDNIRRRLSQQARRENEDLVSAFSADRLGLSEGSRRTRQLSAKHKLPLATVEDVYDTFQKIDVDASDRIDREEFEALLLKLHGASTPDEVPSVRLRLMWQEADCRGAGEIDFERFLLWFSRRFMAGSATDASGSASRCSNDLVSNFYSGMVAVKPQEARGASREEVLATRRRLLHEAKARAF